MVFWCVHSVTGRFPAIGGQTLDQFRSVCREIICAIWKRNQTFAVVFVTVAMVEFGASAQLISSERIA